ncbi:MAG: hypothetical protein HOM25_06715 [Rhodospirillaceae bacterium]|nr:hypothetical protein [Rhodospirillaceae bacterium]MBT5667886.1 hypothetical protein [Rhodospirillaceae bacterium]
MVVIRGRRHWLWRAIDNEGEVLEFLAPSSAPVQPHFQREW